MLSATVPVVIDADDPSITLSAPANGAVLRGHAYVLGGSSSDPSSWVDSVALTIGGAPLTTLNAVSQTLSPFAHVWTLPSDGVYTLRAVARDRVGRTTTSNAATVTVDNTAPQAAFTLTGNAIRPDAQGMTVTLNGTAIDNLSGIARVQISIDDKPWQEVFLADATFPLTQNWQFAWALPGADAQGAHRLRARAFDSAGNLSSADDRTVVVDMLAPTDDLVTQRFRYAPEIRAGEAITLVGKANDNGRALQTVRPEPLAGTLNSVLSATVWLQPGLLGDDDAGVNMTWLGDINGDGRADLAIGLPGARGGAGLLAIVNGRGGNWTRTDLAGFRNVESLNSTRSVFVGAPNAALGRHMAALGDVNGDGLSDVLIGDPANSRAFLVFGQTAPYGSDQPLEEALSGRRIAIDAPGIANFGARVAAAGDVNGDGFNDLLVGGDTRAFLLLGHVGAWPTHARASDEAAASMTLDGAALTVSGIGDLNGDQLDELAVTRANDVRVISGATHYAVRGGATMTPTDGFALPSADAAPRVTALGDVDGDTLADFVYSDANAPQLVLGRANGAHIRRALNYAPAANGFLAAPGDVNADGRMDIVLGNALGDAILIHGAPNIATALPNVAATFSGVTSAASTPFAAGADVNCDASSDILLMPAAVSGGGLASLVAQSGQAPIVPLAERAVSALPVAHPNPPAQPAGITVDDDGGAAHASIQAAIDAAPAGGTIVVRPGVYAPFTIANKNNISIVGVDPDAVFVDGGSAGTGVRVENASGVQVKSITVRNVAIGIDLSDAGLNGYVTPTLRTRIERVVVHSFDQHALKMNRLSSAVLERNTFAGAIASGDYITVTETPDPALLPAWSTLTNTPWAVGAGGGVVVENNRLFALQGDGGSGLAEYAPGSDTWSARASAPYALSTGQPVAGGDGNLYATMPMSWTGYAGTDSSDDIVVTSSGAMFRSVNGYNGRIERWNGVAWAHFANISGLSDMLAIGEEIYFSGDFGSISFPAAMNVYEYETTLVSQTFFNTYGTVVRFDNASQTWRRGVESYTNAIVAMTSGNGRIYIASEFGDLMSIPVLTRTVGTSPVTFAKLENCYVSSGCDGYVKVMVMTGTDLYVGGDFGFVSRDNGPSLDLAVGNIVRIDLSATYPTFDALGGGTDNATTVYAITTLGSDVYAGGDFTVIGGISANKVARYRAGAWTGFGTLTGSGFSPVVNALATMNGQVFIGGLFDTISSTISANLAIWDSTSDSLVAAPATGVAFGGVKQVRIAPATHQVLVAGRFTSAVGVSAGSGVARATMPHLRRYAIGTNTWSNLLASWPFQPMTSTLASDGAGNVFMATMTPAATQIWVYNTTNGNITKRTSLAGGTSSVAMTFNAGFLYLWRGDGQQQLWRYALLSDTWLRMADSPAGIGSGPGASLTWDGGNWLYAEQGGNGLKFARYHLVDNLWEALPDVVVNAQSMAFSQGGSLARIGTVLYATRGGARTTFLRYSPVNPPAAVKLQINNTLFVAPIGDAAATLHQPGIARLDFGIGYSNNRFVSDGTAWTSPVALPTHTHAQTRLVDAGKNVYRVELGGALGTPATAGYHNGGGDAYVSPTFCPTCANDGLRWGQTAFDSIQAAIDSGALRVRVRPGRYLERIQLVSGVSVIGSGADQSIIEAPGALAPGARGVAQIEGGALIMIARVTLSGGGVLTATRVEDGAQHIRLARSVVRDAPVGIAIDGARSDLEAVNMTAVANAIGIRGSACASLDVRNTVFANNTTAGIAYASCAANTLERYNLFYQNGASGFADVVVDSGAPRAAAGVGDLGVDPLFVNAAARDYRLLPDSPAINAGNPNDPTPPGTGGRVDIGYLQQGQAALYADDNYCAQCLNDGLDWQVDAFDKIQPALDAAASEIRALRFAPGELPNNLRLVVGIGPGIYAEQLSVPSYVSLVGVGPQQVRIHNTTLTPTVVFHDVVAAELNGVTLSGADGAPGVRMSGSSNAITVTRNVLRGLGIALEVRERASDRRNL